MIVDLLLLFVSAFVAGLAALSLPNLQGNFFKLGLVFAGSYLFSITIIHILPELFSQAENPTHIGLWVLAGFFLQQVLEYFTSGVEHGHVHQHDHAHPHKSSSAFFIMSGLCLHALMEGSLLAHPGDGHEGHSTHALLIGIVLHKAPAAFALMSILMCQLSRKVSLILLVVFALASPVGLLAGHFLLASEHVSNGYVTILFALVSGNFLHISTTIVFESSLDHRFNARKLGVAMLAGLAAIATEYLV
jgi:zinc and cadmium transporter